MRSFDDGVLKERGSKPHREATKPDRQDHVDASGRMAPLSTGRVMALQRSAGNAAVAQLLSDEETEGTSVRDVVGRGGGQPLPDTSRQQMEQSFGQDFSDVRVHSGSDAASSARSVQAKAYTVGSDIVFGEESPSLESGDGQRALAHELTHVVQQRTGPVDGTPVSGGLSVSDPSDRFEREAESVADTIKSGPVTNASTDALATGAPTSGGVSVQREEDEEAENESEES